MGEVFGIIGTHADTFSVAGMLVIVLGILFRQLATGRLVFHRQLEELRNDKDAENARTIEYYDKLIDLIEQRAKSWETAYTNEAAARDAQGDSLREQLDLARTADYMLRQLPSSKGAPVPRRMTGGAQ
jgi:Tfp pilus assembly protein PilO